MIALAFNLFFNHVTVGYFDSAISTEEEWTRRQIELNEIFSIHENLLVPPTQENTKSHSAVNDGNVIRRLQIFKALVVASEINITTLIMNKSANIKKELYKNEIDKLHKKIILNYTSIKKSIHNISEQEKLTNTLASLDPHNLVEIIKLQKLLIDNNVIITQIKDSLNKYYRSNSHDFKFFELLLTLFMIIIVVCIVLYGYMLHRIFKADLIAREATQKQLNDYNAKLIKAHREAELATEHKSQFLANMSHELRTPLNGIVGMTEMLLQTTRKEERLYYTDIIINSSKNLLNIVNSILDFSKINAGKLDIENEPFNLENTLSTAISVFKPLAEKKCIQLYLNTPTFLPSHVHGDALRLSQVFSNLLSNAIKFTTKGSVSLNVDFTEQGNNVTFHFSVIDTGVGIEKKALDKIFEKFVQEDASVTRKYGGTGLGLAISAEIIELMGGKLDVKSDIGKGTTFFFTLKLSKESDEKPILPPQAKICLLGDFDKNFHLKERIEEQNHTCILMESPHVTKDNYDITFVDIRNKKSVLNECKVNPDLVKCLGKIIILDCFSNKIGKENAIKSDFCAGFIGHPLSGKLINTTIILALENKSTFIDNISLMDERLTIPLKQIQKKTNSTQVLVAEDNAVNRQVIQAMLKKLDCHVEFAEDGQEAVDAIKKKTYDIIFMDFHMPIMDGFEASHQIRNFENQNNQNHTPIILCTADIFSELENKMKSSGIDDVVTKPLRFESLQRILDQWCTS